ncbi:MAG TPA: hypothetical protein VHW23_36795 [Kofleriaceae bacterium]|jgi:hypothetical protein|nr:hypothetical protein [Kofleriaceae bacterium]
MENRRTHAIAVHVCADVETTGLRRSWPPPVASHDTLERVRRICECAGVPEQRTLAGAQATAAGLLDALGRAATALGDDGLLVISFAGHTERGDGPIETTRWCLVGGGVTLAQLADHLARLPPAARVVIIADTCYAAAITAVLHGPQPAVVIAGCGEDQTMIERAHSDFIVRLEDFVCARPPGDAPGTIDALRSVLEDDTPDCERPVVWTRAADRRQDEVFAVPRRPGER